MARGCRAAALALLIGITAQAQAQTPPAASVKQAGDAVLFSGRIDNRSAEAFLQLLGNPEVKRLIITSQGGSVAAALDMGLAIHQRRLDVEVPSDCLSSCANYIFPAARRKTLGHAGAVAWHGNITHVLYLQQTGQAYWSEKEIEEARALAKREAEFFRRIGVDGFVCWFAKIEPYKADGDYYLSVADMEGFGIRDVTVREAAARATRGDEPRLISVDWKRLEQDRPVVPLD